MEAVPKNVYSVTYTLMKKTNVPVKLSSCFESEQ